MRLPFQTMSPCCGPATFRDVSLRDTAPGMHGINGLERDEEKKVLKLDFVFFF